ncbi:nuclear receptor coactivator 7 isoform X5 [Heterocephalus glaber]|uniref:Nuclear receptor coactivator 7 isoform X5 n=1 Tax=Heterocephalus glaber TaxID=10181 RepID=A0AAX6QXK4_HETGA|nr:nuclear receptor coactivator 7 isoform X5 [Heterocephalus glaber]
MDTKEEKKERKQSYFARLKKKKQAKQNAETPTSIATRPPLGKDDANSVILEQDKCSIAVEEEYITDEKKKRKNNQLKEIRRTELKRYYSVDDNQNKTHDKKEKKMVVQKPHGTMEYTAGSQDTLNSIALKFNITPNKLVELNKLFTHTIVPGQVLFVPDASSPSGSLRLSSSSPGATVSPSSSDAEYDKLPDADLARKALKPIERVLSSTSEEDEPGVVKFLKMNCRYFTDGKGVVGGVMIVTPNNIMFDPHKSDPLVIENGCEEYGLICPMEEVVSIALYNDISHMKIKDALPSPGEWEDLASERDLSPFTREKCLEGEDDDFVDLEELSSQAESGVGKSDAAKERPSVGSQEPRTDSSAAEVQARSVLSAQARERAARLQGTLASEACEERAAAPEAEVDPQLGCAEGRPAHSPSVLEDLDKMKLIEFYLAQSEEGPREAENTLEAEWSDPAGIDITLSSALPRAGNTPTESTPEPGEAPEEETEPLALQGDPDAEEKSIEGPLVSPVEPTLDDSRPGVQMNSKSEIQLWLLKRIQVPIEDILPSKEEKSKTPPMFLCIRVGKPMRKSFATHTAAMVQQYGRRRKQPEYWFAVPRERVDHLYTFFVQWSPDVYGKDAKEQGFVVVEKEELNMIDNFFSEPTAKSWEIITVEEAKRRRSTCSYYEDEDDGGLPVLQPHSALLENMHIEQLARRLPARVQGYPWRLAYSTLEHGTSLKTLYRKSASLDSPVLLVIKDMDNQIFGAYATHPFKFSDHYYGTGETFLYTFSPNFKVFKWSGENSYFINGDISSLELGGGGGRFGLWLDADLYHGRSNSCSTFNNDILSKKEDFIVQDLEVWTFE